MTNSLYTGREYYSLPARKAAELQSLDELNLSRSTERYLKKYYQALPEIIWQGRLTAYLVDRDGSYIRKAPKYLLELAAALDREGYLRHDFTANSFTINLLYMTVHYDLMREKPEVVEFEDFCKVIKDDQTFSIDYTFGNLNYETYQNPTTSQCRKIQAGIRGYLTEKEFQVVSKWYGLEGKVMTVREIAINQGVTSNRIIQTEALAIRKIRSARALPSILKPSEAQAKTVDDIIDRLKALRQDPLFQEEFVLRQELRKITFTPYECAEKAKEFLSGEVEDQTEIECLDLTTRTYRALRRAEIYTISDIINYPYMDWLRIKNLGLSSIREVESKMQRFGYPTFRIYPHP